MDRQGEKTRVEGNKVNRKTLREDFFCSARKVLKNSYSLKRVRNCLKEVDDRIVTKLRRKKYILFDGRCPMNFVSFKPVYDRLRKDESLIFYFTNSLYGKNFYEEFHIPRKMFIPIRLARFKKWDLYITTDTRKANLSRKTKRLLIPHGIGDKKGVRGDEPYMFKSGAASFDKICFYTRKGYAKFKERFRERGDEIAVLTGYPRLDYLAAGGYELNEVKGSLGLDNTLPVILFAPTWGEHGALNRFGPAILDRLLELDANILMNLHDHSYNNSLPANRFNWGAILNEYKTSRHLYLVNESDPHPYMAIADILISDYGSLVLEYQILNKPTIFVSIDAHHEAVVSDERLLHLLQEACVSISSPDEIKEAFFKIRSGQFSNTANNEKLKNEYFVHVGSATEKVVTEVHTLLAR
jgi:CDP-glycerol glycerophosphotransferase (TagB/SpsB family)